MVGGISATAGINVYQDSGPSPRLAIVAVGEASYTHGTNWVKEQPYLPPDQLSVIQNFRNQGIPVVVVLVMPRPYVITEWHDLAQSIVVTYRAGEEMGPALASLLFGDYKVKETKAPTGFDIDDTAEHTVTIDNSATCSANPYVGETISFTDTPLSDIQVRFRDAGSGETKLGADVERETHIQAGDRCCTYRIEA